MAGGDAARSCTIILHDDRISTLDVLGGTDVLPIGNIALLTSPKGQDILVIAEARAAGQREISLHSRLGSRFGFENRSAGKVTLINEEDRVTATHVNVFFRDLYLSRSDMWIMLKKLEGQIIYEGSAIQYLGHTVANVQDVYLNGRKTSSALVQQGKTKAIVRSGSARFTILVQLSREMFEYRDACDLMYEKLIEGYLTELFRRWEEQKVRHLVSIVLFGRYQDDHDTGQDFYRTLHLDWPSSRWRDLLISLRKAFSGDALPHNVTLAAKGNLLEAIHISASDFLEAGESLHLNSTGTSIIVVTEGRGSFDAEYALLKKATHIMLGHSIGVDIVSLAMKPTHAVPLFKYTLDSKVEYALPHWAEMSYWSSEGQTNALATLEQNTAMEVSDIALPLLALFDDTDEMERTFEDHDRAVFVSTQNFDAFKMLQNAADRFSTSLESNKTITKKSPTFPQRPTKLLHMPALKSRISSSSIATTISLGQQSKPGTNSRKISLGPRGLAPIKSSAITTISETTVSQEKDALGGARFAPNEAKSGLANQIRASLKRRPSEASILSRPSEQDDIATQPIDIVHSGAQSTQTVEQDEAGASTEDAAFSKIARTNSKTPKAFDGMASSPDKPSIDPGAEARTPWLVLLNPCNIKKDNMRVASQYRQWQHVFPKAMEAGDFKWQSMCSPASLPLYNDLLPSSDDLKKYYKHTTRRKICAQNDGAGKRPQDILKQLIMLRLAHGFQIVSRPHMTEQTHVLMSIGADYHELQCLSDIELEVVEYNHNSSTSLWHTEHLHRFSVPFTVTSWHENKSNKGVTLAPALDDTLDWNSIDQAIEPGEASDSLFRMRFVLLPVDIPGDDYHVADDERRIDGIQRLTQQWQRHRVFTAEYHKHHISFARKKAGRAEDEVDHNPLAIEYHTRDPSTLINSSQYTASTGEQDVRVPLISDTERYHSSNFDLTKLTRRMQEAPPHGIDIRDRRWLHRMHPKCFRGDEMTTWLLSAFKDLKSREEAVELGNSLVERGVFNHVRRKHPFMDGHYLYQIGQAYRTAEHANALTSLFSRATGRSVPPTPSSELRMSPQVRPARGDSDSTGADSSSLAPADKRQVLLSQTFKYNVDTARRSVQDEIINVHYDRIHNPENCYHIYIDWTLTTPMLIRDTISKWSTLVEPYGLRLVQLPWLDAHLHSQRHPFEQPRYIKLALDPPDKIPATPLFGSTASPRIIEDPRFYHKALLRKLDFVLDMESIDSYSNKVEVVVTWGTMDWSMTQFVHRSGLVMAQICNERQWDFLLLPNPLMDEKSNRARAGDSVEKILDAFRALASDVKVLKETYEELQRTRLVQPSPFVRAATPGTDIDVPPMQLTPLHTGR